MVYFDKDNSVFRIMKDSFLIIIPNSAIFNAMTKFVRSNYFILAHSAFPVVN